MAPLMEIPKIESRLDVVEDMLAYQSETDDLRHKLGMMPDLEKLLAKIFTYSIKQKVTPVSYDDVSLIKMKEFRQLLTSFKNLDETLAGFISLNNEEKLKSKRLKLLLSNDEDGGLLPDNYKQIISEFESLIVWKQVSGSKIGAEIAMPRPGIDEELDEAYADVNNIKEELDVYLKGIIRKFKNDKDIKFTHIMNRYEIEFPIDHVKGDKKPAEFEFSSAKAGF